MPTIFGGPVENHKDKQPNISTCEAMQPLQGKILFNTLLALKLIMQFMSGRDMITDEKKIQWSDKLGLTV